MHILCPGWFLASLTQLELSGKRILSREKAPMGLPVGKSVEHLLAYLMAMGRPTVGGADPGQVVLGTTGPASHKQHPFWLLCLQVPALSSCPMSFSDGV